MSLLDELHPSLQSSHGLTSVVEDPGRTEIAVDEGAIGFRQIDCNPLLANWTIRCPDLVEGGHKGNLLFILFYR